MKNKSKPRRVATPEDVVCLAKKMKWRDIHLPNGDVVPAETTRQVFAYAEKALKSQSQRRRPRQPRLTGQSALADTEQV